MRHRSSKRYSWATARIELARPWWNIVSTSRAERETQMHRVGRRLSSDRITAVPQLRAGCCRYVSGHELR